mmetsp:Transcript_52838/g.169194  ORF Transcript_52838/g.169194 Transcript_52838/m.169194 type:complete len:281 (+) Transcript_52838:1792-2634(+)
MALTVKSRAARSSSRVLARGCAAARPSSPAAAAGTPRSTEHSTMAPLCRTPTVPNCCVDLTWESGKVLRRSEGIIVVPMSTSAGLTAERASRRAPPTIQARCPRPSMIAAISSTSSSTVSSHSCSAVGKGRASSPLVHGSESTSDFGWDSASDSASGGVPATSGASGSSRTVDWERRCKCCALPGSPASGLCCENPAQGTLLALVYAPRRRGREPTAAAAPVAAAAAQSEVAVLQPAALHVAAPGPTGGSRGNDCAAWPSSVAPGNARACLGSSGVRGPG